MNFKLNTLVAAALLVAAGSANAAISNAATGNGEMFLVVYDTTAGYSFVGDLGIAIDSFDSASTQSFNLNGFSQWTPFLGAVGGNLGNAQFAVLGADSVGNAAGGRRMLVTSAGDVTADDITATQNSFFRTATTSMDTWLGLLNSNTDVVGGDMDSVANGSAYSTSGSSTYFDNIDGNIQNNLKHNVLVNAGGVANFGLQSNSSTSLLSPTAYMPYAGNFTVNGAKLDYTVAAVPEAETYAMMLAGLGLVGFMVSRRRNHI
jgi:hypothetical protein